MTPAQCQAARELLGWSRMRLAVQAGVNTGTVDRLEHGRSKPQPHTLAALRDALEAAGIEFTNGDAPGVQLRKQVG